MNRPRPPIIQSPLMHRVLCFALAVMLLCAMIPLPMPVRVAKDATEAFPCQHHTCGCRTATQCWTSCCCLTNAQKVEWAEREHAKIPEFVIVAAAQERAQVDKHAACCAKHRRPDVSCSTAVVRTTPPTLTRKSDDSRDRFSATTKSRVSDGTRGAAFTGESDARTRFVSGWNALKCSGQSWDLALGCVLPPLPMSEMIVFDVLPQRFERASRTLLSLTLLPPEPPPRAS